MHVATISSKRQLTIPSAIFSQLGFKEGEKVLVSEEEGGMRVVSSLSLIEKLAGSVKIPARFKGLSIDQMISRAKEEYFQSKYKKPPK